MKGFSTRGWLVRGMACSATAMMVASAAHAQTQPVAHDPVQPAASAPVAGDVAGSAPAAAQVKSEQASSQGLAEIVVTASKRSENLQRAAISLTAVGAAQLATRGITDVGQLQGIAPAVQFQQSFLTLIYIRGVGNYSSQPAVDQSVAFNVDGNYVDRPYGVPNQLFDLERVELLRGPQGTLQGRNSTGGSVNLITAKPILGDFTGSFSTSYGNYSSLTTEGMVNIPIGDTAALRISAAHTGHDAYFDNGYGNGNTYAVRARLLYKPTSRLSILATTEFSRRDERGPTASICPPGSAEAACQGVPYQPFSGVQGQGTDPNTNIVADNPLKAKNVTVYAEVNYDLDFATLTWAPSFRHFTYNSVQTYSTSFGYAPAVNDDMHSEELRLSSRYGSKITWVIGAYYGRQTNQEQNYFLTGGSAPSITVNRPGFDSVSHVYFKNDIYHYAYKSESIFGQVSVPIFTGFRVTLGGRYTLDRKTLDGNVGIVTAGPTLTSADYTGNAGTNQFTYKAGFEYDLARQVMFYANVSTGFKAGGANGVPAGSNLPTTFAPEKNTAYQAGIKSRFLDNRIQVNAEGFYYDYRGYQTSLFGTTSTGVLVGLNTNSQKARIYGGEIEANFLITPRDKFDASLALLDARYVQFLIPSNGLDLSGQRMQNAPGHSFTLGYGHTFDLPNGGNIVAHSEGRYQSGQYVDYRLAPGSYVAGFWRADAELTYHPKDDRWTLGAFVRNITNDGSPVVTNGGLGPYTYAVPLPPRTYGVRASAKF